MRPDPGRDLLEARMAELTRDERALISMELRARGFASVWAQLDRSGISDPVEQVRRQFSERHAAGTWNGPERSIPPVPRAAGRSG
jgi:hypothetical protein